MGAGRVLETLGIGLSRLLRYSYGGFLLIAFATLLNPVDTKQVLDAMSWELIALSAIVLGAGIYAAHRGIVVPLHHLGLCFLLWSWERMRKIDKKDSTSPTRWLGFIGVPRFRRMLAYSAVRGSDIFEERERQKWDVAHAESGLVLMTAEGFFIAALYASKYPHKSQVEWWILLGLGITFVVFSYGPGFGQHMLECMRFQKKEAEIKDTLKVLGMIATESVSRNEQDRGEGKSAIVC